MSRISATASEMSHLQRDEHQREADDEPGPRRGTPGRRRPWRSCRRRTKLRPADQRLLEQAEVEGVPERQRRGGRGRRYRTARRRASRSRSARAGRLLGAGVWSARGRRRRRLGRSCEAVMMSPRSGTRTGGPAAHVHGPARHRRVTVTVNPCSSAYPTTSSCSASAASEPVVGPVVDGGDLLGEARVEVLADRGVGHALVGVRRRDVDLLVGLLAAEELRP